jgi:UDP-N-acetylmuramoylalanine-D-glutamate ligase
MNSNDDYKINFALDDLETVGRKKGVLYLKKAFFRSRDLVIPLIETFERKTILISIGRDRNKFENFKHFQIRSIIRVGIKDSEGLENWSDDLDTFQYVSKTVPKALQLAAEIAQRGDVVLFSPYGTPDEIQNHYNLFDSTLESIGF